MENEIVPYGFAPGRFPHGIDSSSEGNVRVGSGQLGRLDVKTGQWKFWDMPGTKFRGTANETASTGLPYFFGSINSNRLDSARIP